MAIAAMLLAGCHGPQPVEAPARELTINIDGVLPVEVAPGSRVRFLLTGNPGENFIVLQGMDRSTAKFSHQGREFDIGAGENAHVLCEGFFDENGEAEFAYPVSDYPPGQLLYFQAVGFSASGVRISNIVEIKVLSAGS